MCYQMAFQERDVRAEVNGNRGPGISERKLGESSVMFLIDSEGGMIDSGEETIQSGFNFRGVGNFTFNGGTCHLGVVISWLVEERARESSLQTSISGGGADGFSDAMSGRNMFRTRRMCNSLRGTRSRPSLLYSPGVERKGRDEILRGKGNSVSAVAIVRRVDNQGDVIHEHLWISRTIQASVLPRSGCPPTMEKGSGVGDGRTLTAEEVELDDLRLGRIPSRRMTCLACAGQK